ncbi:MAG: polysaccharide pyruvyl transferase family protein [Oscillospiraceae bacterium]|nr:polysaccharide pyruvyl transferase family protein [Oscillospiraceae bacterium]
MKIAICGLVASENLGEQFISKSLAYLIKKELCTLIPADEPIEFVEVDILACIATAREAKNTLDNRIKTRFAYRKSGIVMESVDVALRKLLRSSQSQEKKNRISKIRHMIWNQAYNFKKRYRSYFCKMFSNVDFIVIDGAGLFEYSYNEYQEPLNLISEIAEEKGLSVVYNAVGCSGEYVPEDFRCQILVKAARSKAVKYISARDSREWVQNYAGDRLHVKLLADAAFWLSDTFQIYAKQSEKIGIGLVRGDALQSYGVSFTDDDWVALFASIGNELKARGYAFQYFTNGFMVDYQIGKRVIKKMQLDDSYLVPLPEKPEELMQTISGYKCLITCRMHSSIAALSMKIPSVILSWNKKVDKLMNILGYPERVVNYKDFKSKIIVDKMEAALRNGISEETWNMIRGRSLESVQDYVGLIAAACPDKEDSK